MCTFVQPVTYILVAFLFEKFGRGILFRPNLKTNRSICILTKFMSNFLKIVNLHQISSKLTNNSTIVHFDEKSEFFADKVDFEKKRPQNADFCSRRAVI